MNHSYEELIIKVLEYNPDAIPAVKKAYEYAEELHRGQKRKSKEPYIIHPVNVAYILAELHADQDTLCAGLLHDTVEDTKATLEDIKELFNDEVAKLVDGVTNISKMNFTNDTDENNANTRKILKSLKDDVRIIIIKLADRLHNMRTLEFMPPYKQKEKSMETLNIFVPLAKYLGEYKIKYELEDRSLYYLNKDKYEEIEEVRNRLVKESAPSLEEMKKNMFELLEYSSMKNTIETEVKNIYGIYKKMEENKKFSEIHDLLNLKLIVEGVKNCYVTFGLLHTQYKPINEYFKDYICNPKTNMYRSLHTTVIGPNGYLVQGQIRTPNMNQVADFGISTYWDLRQGEARKEMQKELTEKLQFYKSLKQIDKMFEDNEEFVSKVREEVFSKRIYPFTPNGDVIELPKGATPIDFAYAIHTAIGDKMVGAIVNDEPAPFDRELQSKDRVRIKTDESSKGPDISWLDSCKTTKAKRNILKNNN